MAKFSDRAIAIGCLGLVVVSVGGYYQSKADDNSGKVEPASTDVSIGEVIEKTRTPFACTLANTGSRPFKVRGVMGECRKQGCVTAMKPPDVIPAKHSVIIQFEYQASLPGPFVMNAQIYLDPGEGVGLMVPVTLRGTTLALERKHETE